MKKLKIKFVLTGTVAISFVVILLASGFAHGESANLEISKNLTGEMIKREREGLAEGAHGKAYSETSIKARGSRSNEGGAAAKANNFTSNDETKIMAMERTHLLLENSVRKSKWSLILMLSGVIAFATSTGGLFFLEKRRSSVFEKNSYHDPLTKLANRAYLDVYLKLATSRAASKGEIVMLAFLDLNEFKALNDIFGHAHGDTLLKKVSSSLLHYVHKQDLVARYGGDEFVVVFVAPATHCKQALARMKRAIRLSFKQLANDIENLKVSAAVGISIYPSPSPSIALLLSHADEAMYAVKNAEAPLTIGEYAP